MNQLYIRPPISWHISPNFYRDGVVGLLFVAMASPIPSSSAQARLLEDAPEVACGMLDDQGFRARSYVRVSDELYQCTSAFRVLPLGDPVRNRVRFHARGQRDKVQELKLVLEVFGRRDQQATLRRMAGYCDELAQRALGEALPREIRAAILSGRSESLKIDSSEITVERIVLRQPGFELVFRIR